MCQCDGLCIPLVHQDDDVCKAVAPSVVRVLCGHNVTAETVQSASNLIGFPLFELWKISATKYDADSQFKQLSHAELKQEMKMALLHKPRLSEVSAVSCTHKHIS